MTLPFVAFSDNPQAGAQIDHSLAELGFLQITDIGIDPDLLECWTNGRYKSKMHRVVPKIGDRARLSIAVFIDPDSDTLVETVPACISADNPARFAPMTAGEHLQSRLAASHKGRFDR